MSSGNGLLLRQSTMAESIRFGFVGLLNTLMDLIVFFVLVHFTHWNVLLAQTLSYACGLANSYVLNRMFTFRHSVKRNASAVVKFVLVNMGSYAISELALYILSKFTLSLLFSKIAITGLTLAVNFSGSKWWVFREAAAKPRSLSAERRGRR